MSHPEDAFRAQPVLAAAIAAHGLDVARLPWQDCENSALSEVCRSGAPGLPTLRLGSDGSAHVRWWRGLDGSVSFSLESDGYAIVTIERQETPDAMLTSMAGRRLSDVVEMPGGEEMAIIEAVNSRGFVGDPFDTRMSVRPVVTQPDAPSSDGDNP